MAMASVKNYVRNLTSYYANSAGDVADRITGLELGADDYVVKPFSRRS